MDGSGQALLIGLAVIAALAVIGLIYLGFLNRRLRGGLEDWRGRAQDAAAKFDAVEFRLRDLSERNASLEQAGESWRSRAEAATNERTALETRIAALDERRAELEQSLAGLRTALDAAASERTELAARVAASDAARIEERKATDEKLALLNENREKLTAEFKALAGQVIREHGDDFKKTAADQIGGLVAPLRENIGKFEGELRNAQSEAMKERAALKEQLGTLTQRSEAMSKEAESLTRALRGDTRQQGAWGEAILERLLETSGLEAGREYRTQSSERSDDGRSLRPDVIVSLPGGRELVIDSKVSLTAYDQAVNAEEDTARKEALTRHVRSLQAHIKALSDKNYAAVTSGSLDYVIMFVPIEAALSEAIRAEDGLTHYALDRHVMIATPTTLMMALRTIKTVWDVERRNENAEKIADRAGRIYDKIVGFAADMEKVGKQLDAARSAHSDALMKLTSGRGNALSQIETLKKLGAKTAKALPESLGIEMEDAEEL